MMKISKNNLLFFLICLIWSLLVSCVEIKEDEEGINDKKHLVKDIQLTGSIDYPVDMGEEEKKSITLTLLEDDSQSTIVDENGNFIFMIHSSSLPIEKKATSTNQYRETQSQNSYDLTLVALSANGLYGKQLVTTARSGDVKSLGSLSISKTSSISGTITLPESRNASAVTVSLIGNKITAQSDANGQFLLNRVPAGQYSSLFANKNGESYSVKTLIPVSSEETTQLGIIGVYKAIDVNGQITVNWGQPYSTSLFAKLDVKVSKDTVYMKISEDPNFEGAQWIFFRPTYYYQFESVGKKRLFIKFAGAQGLESGDYIKQFEIIDDLGATPTAPSGSTNSSQPILRWNPDPRVTIGITYQVQVATDNNFEEIILEKSGLTETSFPITETLREGDYYWRLKTIENQELGKWGAPQSFTVDMTAPTIDSANIVDWQNTAGHNTATIHLSATDASSYYVSASSTEPASHDDGWSTLTDRIETVINPDISKAYLWVQDEAGNLSSPKELEWPVITSFSAEEDEANPGNVQLRFTTGGNNAVAYLISEHQEAPSLTSSDWKILTETTESMLYKITDTSLNLRLWVKDEYGNLSFPKDVTVWNSMYGIIKYYSMDDNLSLPSAACMFPDPSPDSPECSSSEQLTAHDVYLANQPEMEGDGKVLALDRARSYYAMPGLGVRSNWSVSLWFNATNFVYGPSNSNPIALLQGYSLAYNQSDDCFLCISTASNHSLGFVMGRTFYSGNQQLVANQWYHALFVQEMGKSTIYLNGEKVLEKMDVISSDKIASLIISKNPLINWRISSFKGVVDELRIYDYSISSLGVQYLYQKGRP